jgi:hypothetical protein
VVAAPAVPVAIWLIQTIRERFIPLPGAYCFFAPPLIPRTGM